MGEVQRSKSPETIKVAFAVIAGDNLADIQTSAIAAQAKYNTYPTCTSGSVVIAFAASCALRLLANAIDEFGIS